MDHLSCTRSASWAFTPSSSQSVSASHSTAGTPDTAKSVLFDDLAVEPLDISDEGPFILVVGGLGYIGSHTTLELLKAGYNVVVVDDLSNSYSGVFDSIKKLAKEHCQASGQVLPAMDLHEVDYRSPSMRTILARYCSVGDERSSKITGVIHFAAFKSVEESISKPLQYYQNNVCGMVDFLATLQDFGIKNFVFSSSATIYGSLANRGAPLREEHCVHAPETYFDEHGKEQRTEQGVYGLTSPYGRTKWMCEAILADFAKADPSWSITALRYFNPVGCHESGLLGELPRQKPSNLMPVIANVLKGSKPVLDVFGTDWATPDGTAIRDFIHVVDLARGHIAALQASSQGKIVHSFRTYNLGTGQGHSVREVVGSIQKASGREIPVRHTGRRDGDVGFCVAQVHRANAELGWKTEKSLDDCAKDLWHFTDMAMRAQDSACNSPVLSANTNSDGDVQQSSPVPSVQVQSTLPDTNPTSSASTESQIFPEPSSTTETDTTPTLTQELLLPDFDQDHDCQFWERVLCAGTAEASVFAY